jgi:ubiquinone/menaquinone biosynthesis C-methylase UbiE
MSEKRPVPPELYTREYYTTDCDGYDLFLQGCGELPERIREPLLLAGDLAGKWILDIGCGRGELVCEAALRGAHAVGIDYAGAALELAQERATSLDPEARDRVKFFQADAKELPFTRGSFDVVFMLDVYEHLLPYEVEATLKEIKRVMRPGGVLVLHTGPNTWFYRYGYPIIKTLARYLLGRELPKSLRMDSDEILHVNEQSPWSLFLGLRKAGFSPKIWPRSYLRGINPSPWENAAMRLLFARPAGYFFCISLLACASLREGGREAGLRVGKVANLLAPARGSRLLLVGEREGKLAKQLAGLADTEVVWLEPFQRSREGGADIEIEGYGLLKMLASAYTLPFADGHFDGLVAQFTLDQLARPEEALQEWVRVLKPKGVLVLVARNRLFRGQDQRPVSRSLRSWSPEELSKLVEGVGMEVRELSTLIPDLRLPVLYRGDLSFSYYFEKLPYFRKNGKLIFLKAVKGA